MGQDLPRRDDVRRIRAFHVRRTAQARYGVDRSFMGLRGDLIVTDVRRIRRLASRMNELRAPGAPSVQAGEIAALGLIHEITHLLVERHEATRRPGAMATGLREVRAKLGTGADALLDRFAREFPGPGPRPAPAVDRLEELLLTRMANENPALGPLRELVDDRILAEGTRYEDAIAALERALGDGPPGPDETEPLLDLIRAPARHAPTSLLGQLRFIREHWATLIGDGLADVIDRLDLAIGILAEEEQGLHRRFGATGPGREVKAPSYAGLDEAPEAFSADSAWMPRVVLMAKSTYVWLDQLSRRYERDIRTLDAIPDEVLDTVAAWGVTGLWLIGLWQRSGASERIKRMRGNPEAAASAYSLDDYRIADDLGGESAFIALRDRAAARGIRLASDMVPNHMGIDSSWVIDHPEWFLAVPESPFPAYSFDGPDLSIDARVGIVLEDHYWDDSDAAVVFKRIDRATGDIRFVYHGNDGTSFPWNDTAQLDFLSPAVREQVIRTIIDVARHFPIIRFDAAMVLAKRHIQRLWWPAPGTAGSVPSRAEHAMPPADFDRRMPTEFWREVVDRLAVEVPDTLLVAEAFWMLEGYFVRTLGMHRVYNSAFMHMLRNEDGAGFRRLIKDTLEFDPEILQRYVNFMSNPDEETAVEQFGKGDKYFGVTTVMATLPGMPMLGHGQVEGFAEKYGMEYRRAVLEERPDPWLVDRHRRDIFPLLHRRAWFAEAADFLLYDFVADSGDVDEHVLAYSNGRGPSRTLVVYHDRFASTSGRIRRSARVAKRNAAGGRRLVRRSLADGLGLPDDESVYLRYRDARTGLEHLHAARDIREHGLALSLDAYGCHVFWEFEEVHDGSAGGWHRLAERLAGAGVPSLDDALRELQLEPVHRPLRAIFEGPEVVAVLDGTASRRDLDTLEARHAALFEAVAQSTGVSGDHRAIAAAVRTRIERAFGGELGDGLDRLDRCALFAWVVLARLGELAPGADVPLTSAAWFDELRLVAEVAKGFRLAGLDETEAWSVAEWTRVLLLLPRPSSMKGRSRAIRDRRLIERWAGLDDVRSAMGVNTWDGVEWLDHDRFVRLLRWAVRLDAIDSGQPPDAGLVSRLSSAAEAAGYRVDRVLEGPVRPIRGDRRRRTRSRPSS